MNEITVVIPCYTINDVVQSITERALASIEGHLLILIDNASPMGGGYLRTKTATYVRNSENLGFAKACNQGIKLAQTKYVALMSTDTFVSPNWCDVALEVFAGDKNTFSCHFRMTDYYVPFKYGNTIAYTGKEWWCTAAFFVLDKEKELLFDEDFFNSYEDWDLFFRARKAGYKTAYTDKACFQHNNSFTQHYLGFPRSEENKKLFKEKYGEYAPDLFAKLYPEQVKIPYLEGFKI